MCISVPLKQLLSENDDVYRSSHSQVFYKKTVLKNVSNLKGDNYCRVSSETVADLQPVTLLKKKLQHRYFLMNFAKLFGTVFSRSYSGNHFQQFRTSKIFQQDFSGKVFDLTGYKPCLGFNALEDILFNDWVNQNFTQN